MSCIGDQSAVAGLFTQSTTVQVPSGTTLKVAEKDGKKIIIGPQDSVAVTLMTLEPVRSALGTILISKGAQIDGQFQSDQGGTQFVAMRIAFPDGKQRSLIGSV